MLSKELKLADDATLPKEVKHYIDKIFKMGRTVIGKQERIDIVVIVCVNAKCQTNVEL